MTIKEKAKFQMFGVAARCLSDNSYSAGNIRISALNALKAVEKAIIIVDCRTDKGEWACKELLKEQIARISFTISRALLEYDVINPIPYTDKELKADMRYSDFIFLADVDLLTSVDSLYNIAIRYTKELQLYGVLPAML